MPSLQSQSRIRIEDSEEATKELREGPLEETNNRDCFYIRLARKRPCVACCTTCTCLVFVILAIYTLVMGILLSRFDDKTLDHAKLNPWPHKDEEGYYQSYQEGGRWVNFWGRDRPSGLQVGLGFALYDDLSGIPDIDDEVPDLPVKPPYWMRNNNTHEKQHFGSLDKGVRATWIGHATVLAEVDGDVILCDPIFSDRCFPFQWIGPKRYRRPACTVDQLPDKVDAVVISHTHYDHMDEGSIKDLAQRYKSDVHWYVPSGSGSFFRSTQNIPNENVHEMVWWEELPLKKQLMNDNETPEVTKIAFTPSNHWSSRWFVDMNKALWGSWTVVGKNGSKFWFGGDTGYSDVFTQIGRKYGPFDLAAIPIGAYSPRKTMKYMHVNPEEAVMIHKDIQSKRSLGIHWGTFKLTHEPFLEPPQKLKELANGNKDQDKVDFLAVAHGETLVSNSVD